MNRELVARRLLAIGAGVLLMGGCTADREAELEVASDQPGDDEQTSSDGTSDPSQVVPAPPSVVAPVDPSATDDSGGTDAAEREVPWPDPIPVDVVGRHAGGLVVEVFEVRSLASSVDLDIRITNGQSSVSTRMTENMDPTRLIDDTGIEYVLVPPEGDNLFTVEKGAIVEGTFSFAGPLAKDATSLTLVINPKQENEDQDRERAIPYLSMEIPLLDAKVDDRSTETDDAEAEADGEDGLAAGRG